MRNKPKLILALILVISIVIALIIFINRNNTYYESGKIYDYTQGTDIKVSLKLDKNKPISVSSSPYYNLSSNYSGKKLSIKIFSRTTPKELSQINIKNGDNEITLYYRTNDTSNYQNFVDKLPITNERLRISETGNYKLTVSPYNVPSGSSSTESDIKKIFGRYNLDFRSFTIVTVSPDQTEEKTLENKSFKNGEFIEGGSVNSH